MCVPVTHTHQCVVKAAPKYCGAKAAKALTVVSVLSRGPAVPEIQRGVDSLTNRAGGESEMGNTLHFKSHLWNSSRYENVGD